MYSVQSLGNQSSSWRKRIFFDSQSFLWKLQWNTSYLLFDCAITSSFGATSRIDLHLQHYFLLFIDSIKTRSFKFTSNKLSIYSFWVNFVLPKTFWLWRYLRPLDYIYDKNQYTRNISAYSLDYPLQVSVLSPANVSIVRTPNNNIYHAQSIYSFCVKAWKTTSKWKEKIGKGF